VAAREGGGHLTPTPLAPGNREGQGVEHAQR
jgi:hypothetical protein